MTTTARLLSLARDWPTLSPDVRGDLIRRHPRTYAAMRRLARRERRAVRS